MAIHLEREKTGFGYLAKLPGDGGSASFVGDFMKALSARGVSELWMRYEPNWRLNQGLGIIHRHARRVAEYFKQKDDQGKTRAYRRIAFAVGANNIGSIDLFWQYVAKNQATWRADGCYIIPWSRAFANACLEDDLEPDYAQLLRGYACLIERKLHGR